MMWIILFELSYIYTVGVSPMWSYQVYIFIIYLYPCSPPLVIFGNYLVAPLYTKYWEETAKVDNLWRWTFVSQLSTLARLRLFLRTWWGESPRQTFVNRLCVHTHKAVLITDLYLWTAGYLPRQLVAAREVVGCKVLTNM